MEVFFQFQLEIKEIKLNLMYEFWLNFDLKNNRKFEYELNFSKVL